MSFELEDEFGDILQKARDGKNWSPHDLAEATGIAELDIQRMERYEWTPGNVVVEKIADALDLHGPSLVAIARGHWSPAPPEDDPEFDLICLNVLMGVYPVKCYLVRCRETNETVIVDTGANPKTIIEKARSLGLIPSRILLTHNHPDHAGGLGTLDQEYACPTWIDKKERQPGGSRDLRFLEDGETFALGKTCIEVMSTPGHTAGGVSFKIGRTVLSGDAIFAGSMGRANSSWSDLYQSITQRLLILPEDTILHPGHGPATTVGEEKRHNPFFAGKV